MIEQRRPARTRRTSDYTDFVPVHVVWEITLACNLRCQHCGSRAGKRRPDELTTEQCLEVIENLARLGTREITLIGGEAFLREDWVELIRAIRSHDIYCAIQTGAWAFTEKRLDEAIEAGLQGLGVSIDGLHELHDRVRGVPGSYEQALKVLRRVREAGLNRSVNTQIGPETLDQLRPLMHEITDAGAQQWQLQLTVAMGNAVDNDALLLQPYQLLELFPLLADLYDEAYDRGMTMAVGNNIGYFGPYEYKFRGIIDPGVHWSGCSAGQTVIGLEADGTMKGCPSLPTVGFSGGNVKDLSVEEIWNTRPEIHFGRLRSEEDLWGFCRTCYYADVCRAGCTWTSHSLLGRPGNNPYCHYRTLELQKKGLRERIRKVENAPDASFAIGRFELVLEEIPDDPTAPEGRLVKSSEDEFVGGLPILTQPDGSTTPERGRVPPRLAQCRACQQFILNAETTCPHCNANVAEAQAQYEADKARREALMEHLQTLISRLSTSPLEEPLVQHE